MVVPFYDRDGITIYHGDCRELSSMLASESVDMVLTDPPYGLGIGYGRSFLGLRRVAGDENARLLEWSFEEASRVLGQRRWACVFTSSRYLGFAWDTAETAGLTVKTSVVWDKGLPGLGMGIRNQYEMLMLTRKGMPRETFTGGNVWRISRVHGRPSHPSEKPIALLALAIERYSEPDQLVFDPFLGSGSSLVAAKQLSRRAIGVEIEERYCEIAARRLEGLSVARLEAA